MVDPTFSPSESYYSDATAQSPPPAAVPQPVVPPAAVPQPVVAREPHQVPYESAYQMSAPHPEVAPRAAPPAWSPGQEVAPRPDGMDARRRRRGKAAVGAAGGAGLFAKLFLSLKALTFLVKFKTALTMVISIAAYAWFFGWPFAVGFVLMLFVHEMGHVVVLRAQGIKASAPMFIPFLGAFVTVKQAQRSVAAEAVSALAGPVAGLAVSGAVLLAADSLDSPLLRALAYTGFFINLFNLLPALPLDGGRVAGALHPAVWLVGMAGAVALLLYRPSPVLYLVLILGGFEAFRRWRAHRRGTDGGYFKIPMVTRWQIGGAYVAVALLCLAGMAATYAPMSF